MAESHVAISISWMGHTKNKHTHKKKHDDMLSCCATKKWYNIFGMYNKPNLVNPDQWPFTRCWGSSLPPGWGSSPRPAQSRTMSAADLAVTTDRLGCWPPGTRPALQHSTYMPDMLPAFFNLFQTHLVFIFIEMRPIGSTYSASVRVVPVTYPSNLVTQIILSFIDYFMYRHSI